jgi:DnaJ domain
MITREHALKVLEINDPNPTIDMIKKQYRILALRYHPDKPSGSNESFRNLTEAYDFLIQQREGESDNPLLKTFVSYIFENYKTNKIILDIINKLISFCEEKSLALLEKIDVSLLNKIYEIIELHREVFTISENFIVCLKEMIHRKSELEIGEHIILNPFIDDLFLDHIYKMTIENKVFLIPLWHHQLIYDHPAIEKKDIVVECFPLLPENITIDSNNNIHCFVIKDLYALFCEADMIVTIGAKSFSIPVNRLYLKKEQEYILYNEGIPIINTKNIYDCSKKSNIYIHIQIGVSS